MGKKPTVKELLEQVKIAEEIAFSGIPDDKLAAITNLPEEQRVAALDQFFDDGYDEETAAKGLLTKERLFAIDLGQVNRLVTYPVADEDWHKKINQLTFLQAALRVGFCWRVVVHLT